MQRSSKSLNLENDTVKMKTTNSPSAPHLDQEESSHPAPASLRPIKSHSSILSETARVEPPPTFNYQQEHAFLMSQLKGMHSFFQYNCRAFNRGQIIYHIMDLWLFGVPLIIMQASGGVVHTIMTDHHKAKLVIAVISAVTAVWIALHMKFNWEASSQRCMKASRMYNTLQIEARVLYTTFTSNVHDYDSFRKAQDRFFLFLQSSKNIEDAVNEQIPTFCTFNPNKQKDNTGFMNAADSPQQNGTYC